MAPPAEGAADVYRRRGFPDAPRLVRHGDRLCHMSAVSDVTDPSEINLRQTYELYLRELLYLLFLILLLYLIVLRWGRGEEKSGDVPDVSGKALTIRGEDCDAHPATVM